MGKTYSFPFGPVTFVGVLSGGSFRGKEDVKLQVEKTCAVGGRKQRLENHSS